MLACLARHHASTTRMHAHQNKVWKTNKDGLEIYGLIFLLLQENFELHNYFNMCLFLALRNLISPTHLAVLLERKDSFQYFFRCCSCYTRTAWRLASQIPVKFSEFPISLRRNTGNEDLLYSQKSSQVLCVSARVQSLYFTIKIDVHNFEILCCSPSKNEA